jgi:hypothetical protein
MTFSDRRWKFIIAVSVILICLKLVFVFWSVDKGFDIGDEGTFLLGYQYPDEYKYLFFFRAIRKLLFFVPLNLVNTRIARNVLEIISTLSISLSLGYYIVNRSYKKDFIWFSLILGLLAIFNSPYSRAISYYDFGNAGACIGFALLLAIVTEEKFSLVKIFWAFLFGVVVGFTAFMRPPTCVAMFLLLIIFISVFRSKNGAMLFAISLSSAIVAQGLYIHDFGGIIPFYDAAKLLTNMASLWGYSFKSMLFYHLAIDFLPVFLLSLITFVIYKFIKPLSVKLILICIIQLLFTGLFLSGKKFCLGWLNAVLISHLLIYYILNRSTHARDHLVFISLLALPFIISLGSEDSYLSATFSYWVPIYLVFAFICFVNPDPSTIWVMGYAIALSLIVFLNNQVFKPFGLTTPIYCETEKTLINNEAIKVSPIEKKFFEGINEILINKCAYKKGDEILSLEFAPGIIYSVGGFSRFTAFYHGYIYKPNCYFINKERPDSIPKPIIIMRGNQKNEILDCLPQSIKCLNESKFAFDKTYQLAGSIPNPYSNTDVYLNTGDTLLFFIPKN